MRRKILEIANKNTVVEVGVVRVKKADGTEKFAFILVINWYWKPVYQDLTRIRKK